MKQIPLASTSLFTRALFAIAALVSVAASATPAAATATAPTAPQDVSAFVTGTSVTVTWSAPESNGGSVITGYVATTVPHGATCTTTVETTCTLKNLLPGKFYSVIVRATNAVDVGDGDSVDITTGLLAASAGSQVKLAKSPAVTVAMQVEVAKSGRTITVAAIAPSNVKRYHLSLFTVSGEKSVVNGAWAKGGKLATLKARAAAAGRYIVVLTATRTNGTKANWNGPVVTLK